MLEVKLHGANAECYYSSHLRAVSASTTCYAADTHSVVPYSNAASCVKKSDRSLK